ncbi:MAG: type II secretion system protein [Bacteroidales bacterium]|nr:type II secretion system protein [Bacteroidales bacterium]
MKLRGFTLVELMVVLTIMATMVAIIMPYATRSNESLSIKQEALNLELAIKYVIDLAIDMKRPTRIVLNRKINNFAIEMATDTYSNNFQPIDKSGDIGNHYFNQNIQVSDIEGFSMEGSNYYLIFDPAKFWPSGSVSLSIDNLIYTINIKGKIVEIISPEI